MFIVGCFLSNKLKKIYITSFKSFTQFLLYMFVAVCELFSIFLGVAKWAVCGNEGDPEAPTVWMSVSREERGSGSLTLPITGTHHLSTTHNTLFKLRSKTTYVSNLWPRMWKKCNCLNFLMFGVDSLSGWANPVYWRCGKSSKRAKFAAARAGAQSQIRTLHYGGHQLWRSR